MRDVVTPLTGLGAYVQPVDVRSSVSVALLVHHPPVLAVNQAPGNQRLEASPDR